MKIVIDLDSKTIAQLRNIVRMSDILDEAAGKKPHQGSAEEVGAPSPSEMIEGSIEFLHGAFTALDGQPGQLLVTLDTDDFEFERLDDLDLKPAEAELKSTA